MKIKTSEATNLQLDYLVAQALGEKPKVNMESHGKVWYGTWLTKDDYRRCPEYSTDWSQGGPIIEREVISVIGFYPDPKQWNAHQEGLHFFEDCPTPLIAAMRCYIASKLGEEVDIPEDLT